MLRPELAVLLALLGVAIPGTSRAQSPHASGGRIRVWVRPDSALVGTAALVSTDSVVLAPDRGDNLIAIRLGPGTRIEVSRGMHGHARLGAVIGMALGTVSGAVIGHATYHCRKTGFLDSICDMGPGPLMAIDAVVGAAGGYLLGTIVGAIVQTEQWAPLRPGSLQALIAPRLGGVQFGASLSF
jgi:hypothetical protein